MKKLLLTVALLFFFGCGHEQSYQPSLANDEARSDNYDDIDPQYAAFIKDLKQGLAECEATSIRLYEEAMQFERQYKTVLNGQHHVFATLTDDQLAICQAYLESRRNYPFDPKTLVLLRAVKTSLSAESACAPESNPGLPAPNKYVLLIAIWDAGSRIEERQSEILAEMKAAIDRDARLREGGKLYLKWLQRPRKTTIITPPPTIIMPPAMSQPTAPRLGSAELYRRYEDQARQQNRDMDISSIEQSLREMSRYQKYGY